MAEANDLTTSNKEFCWHNFKQFPHRYLVNTVNEDAGPSIVTEKCDISLPYPISNPTHIDDFEACRDLFKDCDSNLGTRMEYYRRLYRRDKIKKKDLKGKDVVELPQYIIEMSQTLKEIEGCNLWNYTGGLLDAFHLHGKNYIVNCGLNQSIQVSEINNSNNNFDISCAMPVYCNKVFETQDYALLLMRHKRKTIVNQIIEENDALRYNLICKTTSNGFYTDMSFSSTKSKKYATVTTKGKLTIYDLEFNKEREKYKFDIDQDTLSDELSQIEFVDDDRSIYFMTRCCIYILDLRSLQLNQVCLKNSWLQCDDLCCITKSKQFTSCLYVTSKHKLINLDMRHLKSNSPSVMHMLASVPFITSVNGTGFNENICLLGQLINDRVLIQNNGTFSTPLYIPNNLDSLTKTSLTCKVDLTQELEQCLGLPIVGMKLFKEPATEQLALYTSTSAGDIFKQTLYNDINVTQKLSDWIKNLPQNGPKKLEATAVRNLSKMMYNITNNFPKEHNLKRMMGTDKSQLFREQCGDLSPYLKSRVGQAIDAIWEESTVDICNTEQSSANKVSGWLSSMP